MTTTEAAGRIGDILTGSRATVRVYFGVPQYGATTATVWRLTRLTAHDGYGTERTLRGDGLPAFGVTQLVDAAEPVLDRVALTDQAGNTRVVNRPAGPPCASPGTDREPRRPARSGRRRCIPCYHRRTTA